MTALSVRWRLLALSACAAAMLALLPAVVLAAGELDQAQTQISPDGFEAGVGVPQVAAQIFTAGKTGGLDQVDLYLARFNNPGDLVIQIQTSSSPNQPTGFVLASATVSETSLGLAQNAPQWVSVSLAAPAEVVAGTRYALVLSAPNGVDANFYKWFESGAYAYGRGPALLSVDSGHSWPPYTLTDYVFKTYVAAVVTPPLCQMGCDTGGGPNPQNTPELDSLLLFGSGLAGLGWYGLTWRRARRVPGRPSTL